MISEDTMILTHLHIAEMKALINLPHLKAR